VGELCSKSSSTGLAGPSPTDEVGLAGSCIGLDGGLLSKVWTGMAGVLSTGEDGGEVTSSGLCGPAASSSD